MAFTGQLFQSRDQNNSKKQMFWCASRTDTWPAFAKQENTKCNNKLVCNEREPKAQKNAPQSKNFTILEIIVQNMDVTL